MKTNAKHLPLTDALIDSAIHDDAALLHAHMAHANLERINADLLAALEAMVQSYEHEASMENPALLQARAALSKARGKA